jgi:type IV pilus assembly protein PilA
VDEHRVARRSFRENIRDGRGFTLIELLVVVVIIGVLAAIAIPAYVGQQDKAKDTAAQAQLRTAATAQQLFYAEKNTFADTVEKLVPYGFRQGEQEVNVRSGGTSYCMEAPGGSINTFRITEDVGRPVEGACTST